MDTNDELPAECVAWLAEVNRIMKRDWYLDSDGAGWSRENILRYWGYGDPPEEFVDWFAEKYDLIDFRTGWGP